MSVTLSVGSRFLAEIIDVRRGIIKGHVHLVFEALSKRYVSIPFSVAVVALILNLQLLR